MKALAQARIKRVRALELVAEGKSYDEIAQAVGYSHRGSAHRAVFKALDDREAEGVDHLRATELARLDALQVALWDRAMDGDVEAVLAVLRIMDRRIRLLALVTSRSSSHASEKQMARACRSRRWRGASSAMSPADSEQALFRLEARHRSHSLGVSPNG